MIISNKLKEFLNRNDIKEAINRCNFTSVYDELLNLGYIEIRNFSLLCIKSRINPLKYMDAVPSCFLLGTKITNIEIPNNINHIGAEAFENSSIENITLPKSVISIGKDAFKSCHHLKSINIPSKVKVLYSGTFAFCDELKELHLPLGLKKVSPHTFSDVFMDDYDIYYNGTKEQFEIM